MTKISMHVKKHFGQVSWCFKPSQPQRMVTWGVLNLRSWSCCFFNQIFKTNQEYCLAFNATRILSSSFCSPERYQFFKTSRFRLSTYNRKFSGTVVGYCRHRNYGSPLHQYEFCLLHLLPGILPNFSIAGSFNFILPGPLPTQMVCCEQ